jgi:hypothetical protein
MPPLWQYFVRLPKADESIAAPKGRVPSDPAAFSLQTGRFQGTAGKPMIAVVDPQPTATVMVGEGHAPVVAVLHVLWRKARRAHLRPQRSLTSAP